MVSHVVHACRWGLGKEQASRVRAFAHAWCDWAHARGHVRTIREETYLSIAEDFVREFLASDDAAESAAESARSSNSASGTLDTPRGTKHPC